MEYLFLPCMEFIGVTISVDAVSRLQGSNYVGCPQETLPDAILSNQLRPG